jgi:glycosyltransferase involved in cell wall biosynthesis
MSHEYHISIVIPTYNRAHLIAATINSVLAQTIADFEVIIVDDGSTDQTADVIKKIVHDGVDSRGKEPPIRCLYQSNQGQSVARNNGIAHAAGNWIAFVDSDDVWLPQKLELQVEALRAFPQCGACFTDARLVDRGSLNTTAFQYSGKHHEGSNGVASDYVKPLARTFGGTWIQTLVARTDLVKKIGGFDPEIHFAEDHDFLFRLALITPHCYVNQPLAVIERTNIKVDPAMALRDWDKLDFRLRAQQKMYEKWLKMGTQYPADVRQTITENLRSVHSAWANWYLETKQFDRARHSVSTAMRYRVTPQLAVKWALTWTFPHIARKLAPREL